MSECRMCHKTAQLGFLKNDKEVVKMVKADKQYANSVSTNFY